MWDQSNQQNIKGFRENGFLPQDLHLEKTLGGNLRVVVMVKIFVNGLPWLLIGGLRVVNFYQIWR